MKKCGSKSPNIALLFGALTTVIMVIRVLLTPITDCITSVANGILSDQGSYFSIETLFRSLFSRLLLPHTEYLGDGLLSMVMLALTLLPFVVFAAYLFLLYRKDRYNVLLPMAFLMMLGIGMLMAYGYTTTMWNLTDFDSESFSGLVSELLSAFSASLNLFVSILWVVTCLVLMIDSAAKFRLRWLSIFCLACYITTSLAVPVLDYTIDTLSLLVKGYFMGDTAVMSYFGLWIMLLPYHLLNNFGPLVLNLLPAATYLVFWFFAAIPEKALPATETVEEIEEIEEEIAEEETEEIVEKVDDVVFVTE